MRSKLENIGIDISRQVSVQVKDLSQPQPIEPAYQEQIDKVHPLQKSLLEFTGRFLTIAKKEAVIMFQAGHGRGVIFYHDDPEQPLTLYVPQADILKLMTVLHPEDIYHLNMLSMLYDPASEAVIYMTNSESHRIVYLTRDGRLLYPGESLSSRFTR